MLKMVFREFVSFKLDFKNNLTGSNKRGGEGGEVKPQNDLN